MKLSNIHRIIYSLWIGVLLFAISSAIADEAASAAYGVVNSRSGESHPQAKNPDTAADNISTGSNQDDVDTNARSDDQNAADETSTVNNSAVSANPEQHSSVLHKVSTASHNTISNTAQDAIGNMLLQSVSLMGIAYKWGGNTPNTGMDCSGFVRYVFQKSLGINLPRTAAEMAKVGKRIPLNQLKPGDLIFFNTRRGSNTHIGIYLGSNKFIQSPRTGENIQISDLSGYWANHFNGAKRVVEEDYDENGVSLLQSYSNVRNQALPGGRIHAATRASKSSRHARHRHAKASTTHSLAHKHTERTHHSHRLAKKSKKHARHSH